MNIQFGATSITFNARNRVLVEKSVKTATTGNFNLTMAKTEREYTEDGDKVTLTANAANHGKKQDELTLIAGVAGTLQNAGQQYNFNTDLNPETDGVLQEYIDFAQNDSVPVEEL